MLLDTSDLHRHYATLWDDLILVFIVDGFRQLVVKYLHAQTFSISASLIIYQA